MDFLLHVSNNRDWQDKTRDPYRRKTAEKKRKAKTILI